MMNSRYRNKNTFIKIKSKVKPQSNPSNDIKPKRTNSMKKEELEEKHDVKNEAEDKKINEKEEKFAEKKMMKEKNDRKKKRNKSHYPKISQ